MIRIAKHGSVCGSRSSPPRILRLVTTNPRECLLRQLTAIETRRIQSSRKGNVVKQKIKACCLGLWPWSLASADPRSETFGSVYHCHADKL